MRQDTFRVEDGFLIRSVVPERGEPYEHSCPLSTYEAVAHAIDERAGQGVTAEDLTAALALPHTQVNLAFAFMKERGCLGPVRGRKHAAASGCVHLDAMTEYHALREGASGS